jgi:hypothetical protein
MYLAKLHSMRRPVRPQLLQNGRAEKERPIRIVRAGIQSSQFHPRDLFA